MLKAWYTLPQNVPSSAQPQGLPGIYPMIQQHFGLLGVSIIAQLHMPC